MARLKKTAKIKGPVTKMNADVMKNNYLSLYDGKKIGYKRTVRTLFFVRMVECLREISYIS